jgi:hypothetical protein
VKLTIDAKAARKSHLGRRTTTIGTARGSLSAAGARSVTVKLTRKARGRMARLGTVSATLRIAVVDGAGATSRKQQPIRLKR